MVQEAVAEKIEGDDLALFVVWIPMYPGDGHATAIKSKKLVSDARSRHYWDAKRTVGKLFRESIGLPEDKVPAAWDVYLVFDKETQWTKSVPRQKYLMHQLSREHGNFLDGETLFQKVEEMLK